jgi:serine/threonine protein kinase
MSITSQSKCCPQCGGPIPAEAPQGLCPKCLFLQASAPTEAGKAAASISVPPTPEELAAAFPQLDILELIGQGGMGFVYKARQPKIERLVALKILPASLAGDPAFAERFTREGRMLARLSHPNIVAIHDFGQAGGFFYLLMEFVDGVNLRQAMRVGRFTPAQALEVVPKICEALQFAHNEGILHRDIKPENILLDSKGRVKIADFGIAKLVGAELPPSGVPRPGEPDRLKPGPHALTETGKALGTPHYMAPEQLEHPQDVDQRADIYSLGVVFYEMLTGELPLGRFAPPSEKSAVDARLDEVVLHTLEKERERRTQTAGEVKTQVEAISRGGKVLSAANTPVGFAAAPALAKPDRFWRWFAVVVLALILIPVGIAVLGVLATIAIPAFVKERARHQQSMEQPGKTVVLTGATNELLNATDGSRYVRVHSDSTLVPGETIVGMTQMLDGQIVDHANSLFINRLADRVQTSCYFSWTLPDSFSPDDFEAAATQVRQNVTGRPLKLALGKPLELFSVTNRVGGLVRGFIRFDRTVPGKASAAAGAGAEVQATVRLRPYGGGLLAFYTATVPPGYFLEAADNSSELGGFGAHTSINSGAAGNSSSWSPPPSFPYELQREAVAQLEHLAEKGPLQVVRGEPRQLFSITNKGGDVYRGFLELVGPPEPAEMSEQLPPTGGSPKLATPEQGIEYVIHPGDTLSLIIHAYRQKNITVTAEQIMKANPGLKPARLRVGQRILIPTASLAAPAPEGELVLDSVEFKRAHPEHGELVWGFKCFVPPGHLASILFVRWTNGVPQVDPGFSGYFKVGEAGGIDIPFCSLSCHRILESQSWKELNEDQRRQTLAAWKYPESSGITNAVRWDVNLGLGSTGSRWVSMPPYRGHTLALPQSISSGHQRAVRLIDSTSPEGDANQGQSGVELRIFLEPLKSPPIRTVPNEVDHTNYIAGTGLSGTMEDALRAIKEWPTDP